MIPAQPVAPPSRLERIPTLPVFLKLAGKRALVVGGDAPAVWKTELLVAAGARVDIVAVAFCAGLLTLAAESGSAAVRLFERPWTDEDLAGAAIAIGAIADDDDAARFQMAARKAGVPVNVIDKPAFCDFQFGTLVARSPLVVAITTDGAAPVFGQALRMWLEAFLPSTLRAWAEAAKTWRPLVAERNWDFRRRRRFWEMLAERALRPDAPLPDGVVLQACLDAAESVSGEEPTRLLFVGCGSGAPDELTLAAVRTLQSADVIIHDADVPSETAQLGRREAARMVSADDADAFARIASQPRTGSRIVWLGTGNPLRCPHWRQRRDALGSALKPVEPVAGLERCPRCLDRCLAWSACPATPDPVAGC